MFRIWKGEFSKERVIRDLGLISGISLGTDTLFCYKKANKLFR